MSQLKTASQTISQTKNPVTLPTKRPPFKFSRKSKKKLARVNPKLVLLANEVIKTTHIDFAITDGLRSTKRENDKLA